MKKQHKEDVALLDNKWCCKDFSFKKGKLITGIKEILIFLNFQHIYKVVTSLHWGIFI